MAEQQSEVNNDVLDEVLDVVNVAVGVLYNSAGEVLIAKRSVSSHQGGLWEFPGGKIEKGETVLQALVREIEEEMALFIINAEPLLTVQHHYHDKHVRLHVWHTRDFHSLEGQENLGSGVGKEGQEILWVPISQLNSLSFPAANTVIIETLMANF